MLFSFLDRVLYRWESISIVNSVQLITKIIVGMLLINNTIIRRWVTRCFNGNGFEISYSWGTKLL
jgi:tagatose-1,6-bisphosphate aldolase non-catalytic subunit AgaZ/GatZ